MKHLLLIILVLCSLTSHSQSRRVTVIYDYENIFNARNLKSATILCREWDHRYIISLGKISVWDIFPFQERETNLDLKNAYIGAIWNQLNDDTIQIRLINGTDDNNKITFGSREEAERVLFRMDSICIAYKSRSDLWHEKMKFKPCK